MKISNKKLKHYKNILQNGLNNFEKAVCHKKRDERYNSIIRDWKGLIDSEARISNFAQNVKDVNSLFGFSREFSCKLSYEELIARVSERFAELDLAKHIIRELELKDKKEKLEKLIEGAESICDFRLLLKGTAFYAEAKYIRNITANNLSGSTKKALAQIEGMMPRSNRVGCVWIFTYQQIDNPSNFQRQVMNIKQQYSNMKFPFKLNVQTYFTGLYGDTVIR